MDKLREEFENWFSPRERAMKSQGLGLISISRLKNRQWEAWRDSRASIVVDIDWPEANDDHWKNGEEGAYAAGHTDGRQETTDAVVRALRSIGLSIKGE
ncbi:hypothetical protein [Serratia ureilytica]|uniref:hypothetical protein n=1 Tax=Serratia ureilytica TaxID=300181 RepID=UPI0034C5D201